MGALIRIELGKVFRSRLALAALGVLVGIAVVAALINVKTYYEYLADDLLHAQEKWVAPNIITPYARWMPLDAFTLFSRLFFFSAPLLLALVYAWTLRDELNRGWTAQAFVRTSPARHYAAKWVAAFVAGGAAVAIPLAVNFLVLACFAPLYAPDIFNQLYYGIGPTCIMTQLFFQTPQLYVLVRLALDFLLGGLWSAAAMGLAVFIRNRVAAVTLPYVGLLFAKFMGDRVLMQFAAGRWRQSFTIIDLMSAGGDTFIYRWEAVVFASVGMLALSLVPPLIARKRGLL